MNKLPYLVEYFGIKDLQNIETISNQTKELGEFLKGELTRLHLDTSFKAYEGIIKSIEKELNINPHERADYRLQKVASWVRSVLIPQRDIDLRKKLILG